MNEMKTPPNSVEAERAVLGSILLDTTGRDERVMDVCQSSGVTPETFFDPRNRAIYAEMQRMARESKPLDALTLAEEMMKAGTLEAVGGAAYVQSLIDQTPTTAHAEYYINIILGKQLRRTMIDSATRTIEKCFDEGEYPDAQAVLGEAEKSFLEIGVRGDATMPWAAAMPAAISCSSSLTHHFRGLMSSMTPAATITTQPSSMPRTWVSILEKIRVARRKPRNMARPPRRGMG